MRTPEDTRWHRGRLTAALFNLYLNCLSVLPVKNKSITKQAADFAEQFRSYSESEKQWKARMEFILRHLPDYRDPPDGGGRLDQLLSLSMVWANHLFLGCSYNKDLLDKVMEMADGIEVEDLPQFTTRSELMRKHQS